MQDLDSRASTSHLAAAVLVAGFGAGRLSAQELPTDAQIQAAFRTAYNHLGLMEYCQDRGFAAAADVANARKSVNAVVAGMSVGPAARAHEAVGRRGDIVGPQLIGLLDASNSARPEVVPEGRAMSLAANARAQNIPERTLCSQMAPQEAPLPWRPSGH